MVQSSIEQKRAFVTIRAEIETDGVTIRESSPLTTYRAKVPFEEIPEHPFEQATWPRGWILAAALGLAAFARAAVQLLTVDGASVEPLIWTALFTVAAAFQVWERSERFIGYTCSSGRLRFFDQPGERSPRAFIAELQRRRSEYFREFSDACARGEDGPAARGKTSGAWLH